MDLKEIVCQAHMAGQHNQGHCDPSWSEAFAYWKSIEEKLSSSNKRYPVPPTASPKLPSLSEIMESDYTIDGFEAEKVIKAIKKLGNFS